MPRKPTDIPDAAAPFNVNIANDPRVSVVNDPESPVPVGDVQNPAFKPFQVDTRFSLGRGEFAGESVLPPAGNENQRVVIEHVTVSASLPSSQGMKAYIKIGEISHALVMTPQDGWSNPRVLRASQPIKLYSIGGGVGMAWAGVERSHSTGSSSFYFTASGYLVDLEQA